MLANFLLYLTLSTLFPTHSSSSNTPAKEPENLNKSLNPFINLLQHQHFNLLRSLGHVNHIDAMATPASSSILQPQQQQAGLGETNPEAVTSSSSSAWQSSGSIGPFFAVISVLTVLAVLSCCLGRMWNRRAPTPLESIKGRGCFGWVKRHFRWTARDVAVGGVGAKVMVCDEEHNDCKVKDGDVSLQNQPQV